MAHARTIRNVAGMLVTAGLLAVVGTAAAEPIDLAQRTVLLNQQVSPARADVALLALRTQPSGRLTFNVPKGTDLLDARYALFVGLPDDAPDPRVLINGQHATGDSFRRDGGRLFRIVPWGMKEGDNLVEFQSPGGEALQINEATIFSLVDTFEEVHFDRAFASSTVARSAPAPDADQLKYDVQHYDLDITLSMTTSTIPAATLTMTAKVTDPAGLSRVVLDFNNNGGALAVSSVDSGPSTAAIPFSYSGDFLVLTLPATVAQNSDFTVRIQYSGTPDPVADPGFSVTGFVREVETGSNVVYTFSEAYQARKWWPCKDIPTDKATMDTSITCPTGNTAVSNGILLGTTNLGGGLTRFDWSETHPMATYLASIACSNFTYASGTYTGLDNTTTMTVGHYVLPGSTTEVSALATSVTNTIGVVDFFADKFGEYPFLNEKYVTATWGASFGMEHQTCTSTNVGDLTSYAGGAGKSRRNVHELAHQWFGDKVTMQNFDHVWLNEGWATYCEALYREHDEGLSSYFSVVNGWNSSGINNTVPLVDSTGDLFTPNVFYRKGGFVLHMLRHVMGDTAFFTGTKNYLATHAYSNANTQDFENAMTAAHGSSLAYFFNEWVDGPGTGRPRYTWSWSANAGTNSVSLSVTQPSHLSNPAGTVFTMPIDVRVTDPNGNVQTFVAMNNATPQTIPVSTASIQPYTVEFDPNNYILKTSTSTTPVAAAKPTLLRAVKGASAGTAQLFWSSGGGTLNGYQIIKSTDMATWTIAANLGQIPTGTTSTTISGLTDEEGTYFRLRAMSDTNGPSPIANTYGVRRSSASSRVLVVDGFDRNDNTGSIASHSWAGTTAQSVAAFGVDFDSCANEDVGTNVSLASYAAVIWVLGNESTVDETFSSAEQALVQAYLDAGGKVFLSGSEVAWDLRGQASETVADNAFLTNYLKADYSTDNAGTTSCNGTGGGIFAGLSFPFGSAGATHGASSPDTLVVSGGSTSALLYSTSTIAGIQYSGTFGSGSTTGKLVMLGFPFETINTSSDRDAVMARVLTFFGLTGSGSRVGDYELYEK